MSNPRGSPSDGASPGIVGPVESAFDLAWKRFGSGTAEAKHNSKLIWYLASTAMYNMMTEAIRAAATRPQVLSIMTQAVKLDIDTYLSRDDSIPVLPGGLGTGQPTH